MGHGAQNQIYPAHGSSLYIYLNTPGPDKNRRRKPLPNSGRTPKFALKGDYMKKFQGVLFHNFLAHYQTRQWWVQSSSWPVSIPHTDLLTKTRSACQISRVLSVLLQLRRIPEEGVYTFRFSMVNIQILISISLFPFHLRKKPALIKELLVQVGPTTNKIGYADYSIRTIQFWFGQPMCHLLNLRDSLSATTGAPKIRGLSYFGVKMFPPYPNRFLERLINAVHFPYWAPLWKTVKVQGQQALSSWHGSSM